MKYEYGTPLTIEELKKDIETRLYRLKKRNVLPEDDTRYTTLRLVLSVINQPDNALTRTMPSWVEEMENAKC
jgi:hypothetical protein